MSFLITRPDHEPTTKYLSAWSEKVIKLAEDKGQKVIDLKSEKATRKEFEGRLSKLNPSLVVLKWSWKCNCSKWA